MKNKIIIAFSFYFFLASIGVIYGKHSCGSRESNSVWGFSLSFKKVCGCSHDSNGHKKSCCKTESKWVKAKTDSSKTQTSLQLTKLNFNTALFFYSLFNPNSNSQEKELCFEVSHSPPPEANPLFLTHRSLII